VQVNRQTDKQAYRDELGGNGFGEGDVLVEGNGLYEGDGLHEGDG